MKWPAVLVLFGSLLLAVLPCRAQVDGGGRDVTVALFSAQPPRSVTVAAAGVGAWWAACAACWPQPLTTVLHMPGTREIVAGGTLSVRDETHGLVRTATGKWHLRQDGEGNVEVVLTLPSERYVAAVLMGEAAAGDPRESLRTLAVVARTFVLRLPAGKRAAGRLPSDVCDSTACQAIRLGAVSDAVSESVRSTAGETLWFGPERAQVFFSASCGGTVESACAVWPKLPCAPYMRTVADSYCIRKDRAAWHAEVPIASLLQIAAREGWHVPPQIVSVAVGERTASQRARTVVFSGAKGERAAVSAPALRLAVGRSLGWNLVRSDAYQLRTRDGVLVFDGHGHGHGAGLCQQGATEMARLGKSYREILAFYFPGTAIRITRMDEGWKETSTGGVALRNTGMLPTVLRTNAVDAWAFARARFSLQRQVAPTVTFAPSTELFRQTTAQPGWQLASTSGTTITLQPSAVFAATHASPQATLRHEMLHVAVEAGANPNAPLWLREGLVEVLSGDMAHGAPLLSAKATDRLLRNAGNREESQTAHAAAAARTRRLVERYGMSAVRGLLESGAPLPPD